MEKIIGFIGSGNMASAMINGIVNKGDYKPNQVIISDVDQSKMQKLSSELGIIAASDNHSLAQKADILFLSVKPNIYQTVIKEIKDDIKDSCIIITIAAGQKIELTEKRFGHPIKLVRAMPNTPAMVGEGMTGITPNANITNDEINEIQSIFNSFGKVEVIPESLMDAVCAVSGSSPAFVFMFIEAMADGAVAAGMPRAQAYTFASQAVMGSAKMVLETGKHPGELKDMVSSPAGTTIDSVASLEKNGFRSAVMEAIRVCVKKSIAMSK